VHVQLSGSVLTLFAKRVIGSLYGGCNAHVDIPRLLDLYRVGRLKLDELITKQYPLSAVARGHREVTAGSVVRGVVAINPRRPSFPQEARGEQRRGPGRLSRTAAGRGCGSRCG
jgi:hypothetical protein